MTAESATAPIEPDDDFVSRLRAMRRARLPMLVADEPPVASEPQPVTFTNVADEWLAKYPARHAVRPTTMENYKSFLGNHLVPAFGALPITAVTPEAIEDFIEAKRKAGGSVRSRNKPLADSSIRTGLEALGLILRHAMRRKLIPTNPIDAVDWRGRPRDDGADPFVLRERQAILTAAAHVDPELGAIIRLWGQGGPRKGEVFGLRAKHVDLEHGVIHLHTQWSRRREGSLKTGGPRDVSFLHPVFEDTAEWRPGVTEKAWSVVAELLRLIGQDPDPERFVFGRGSKPLDEMQFYRRWHRVLSAAKVRYRNPEQLRHTFASTMLSRGAPLVYVQKQGGWRSASVLLRVYARWLPEGIVELAPNPTVSRQVQRELPQQVQHGARHRGPGVLRGQAAAVTARCHRRVVLTW